LLQALLLVSLAQGAELRVMASIFPVADMVRQVGGQRVEVQVLIPPGADPHGYEPPPSVVRQLREAELFFQVGAGLELWAEGLLKAAGAKRVLLTEGMRLLSQGPGGQANPHVWLDPLLAVQMTEKIKEALLEADPPGGPLYEANARRFIQALRALDEEIRRELSALRGREFASLHPAWDYFALRYGLRSLGSIRPSPSRPASPRALARLARRLREAKVRVVLAEEQMSLREARVLASEAGARVVLLDPLGGVPGRDSYLALMRYNLRKLLEALRNEQGS